MKCTEIKLTPQDICEIIRACGDSGVTEFKLDKIHIKRNMPQDNITTTVGYWSRDNEPKPDLEGQVESEALEEEGDLVRDRQISETIVTDPSAFEELVVSGEINAETEYSQS